MAPLDALTDASTIGRIDGVAEHLGESRYRYATPSGSVTWERHATSGEAQWTYDLVAVKGVNPLDGGRTDALIGLRSEVDAFAQRPIPSDVHHRPYAYESLAQLFDDPKTPDVLLVPAAGFPLHGNTGNHGSLTSVQSRGLFFASGAGVRNRGGWVPEHGRTVDVAPTILALLGAPCIEGIGPTGAPRSDARLRAQDGDELTSVIDPDGEAARHVVVILLDGANTNLVADVIDAGEAPTLAALLASGTGLRHGIVSSFPTVTLPNHVTAYTGVHPGRHGVINNEFCAPDGRHINLLDFREMVHTCSWLSPEVETLHEAVHRWQPEAFTSAMYEYADRGANWSTYGEFRAAGRPYSVKADEARRTSTPWAFDESSPYAFMSRIDESALGPALEQWRRDSGHPLPTLQLLTINLTDAAGHASGPHGRLARASVIDSDRRVARLLAAIDEAGAREHTAIVVLSDHGMEHCDLELLERHAHADLAPLLATVGRRDVGDALCYPVDGANPTSHRDHSVSR
jgi:phosphonoacetate hydrolase